MSKFWKFKDAVSRYCSWVFHLVSMHLIIMSYNQGPKRRIWIALIQKKTLISIVLDLLCFFGVFCLLVSFVWQSGSFSAFHVCKSDIGWFWLVSVFVSTTFLQSNSNVKYLSHLNECDKDDNFELCFSELGLLQVKDWKAAMYDNISRYLLSFKDFTLKSSW